MRQAEVDGKLLLDVAAFLATHPDIALKDLQQAGQRKYTGRDIECLVRAGVLSRGEARDLVLSGTNARVRRATRVDQAVAFCRWAGPLLVRAAKYVRLRIDLSRAARRGSGRR